jgi:CspA family cold shock protein
MTGTVKIKLTEKRCGFIVGSDNKEYFFHESALKNISYDDLKKGQEVEFEDAEGERGPRAEDVFV